MPMTSSHIEVSILGGSGYTGGEALRLLLGHPHVSVKQVTSERYAGKPVTLVHPNLRGATNLNFTSINDLAPCDVLIVGLPHGMVASQIDHFRSIAPKIIDKSSDFRLSSPADYKTWYDWDHPRPELLPDFVYGIPELYRTQIAKASFVACAGCNATASIMAIYPFIKQDLIDREHIVIDAKTASSEAGNRPTLGTHHAERAGVVRSYALSGHRHIAEIEQMIAKTDERGQDERGFDEKDRDEKSKDESDRDENLKTVVHFSATAVELTRGVLVTAHLFLKQDVDDRVIWQALRDCYSGEPFIRIVKTRSGIYRMPEPKIVMGTNYCDIGFERDLRSNRLIVVAALDNLMKGAAGQAVQCLNVMMGFEERAGLTFTGLHPV